MLIARNNGLAVHHVAVQALADRLAVSADLEVEGTVSLSAAHETASRWRKRSERSSGPRSKSKPISSRCRPPYLPAAMPLRSPAEIGAALSTLAADSSGLKEVHDVRVRETADGEIVNFHCRVDPALSVSAVHDLVDGIEQGCVSAFPASPASSVTPSPPLDPHRCFPVDRTAAGFS